MAREPYVAMESTGVYWKPIYNLLEGAFTLLVVNAHHIKVVPGRKTDVKDAEWITDLLRHGLITGSFIPERSQRELRELLCYRQSLIQERSRLINTIEKVLEGANIKLGAVVSHVAGASGRAMLEAVAWGNEEPQALAELAKGRLHQKCEALEQAMRGLIGPHQRMMLQSQLRRLSFLDEEVGKHMVPFQEAMERMDEIPGVGTRTAQAILCEIGLDMSRFPNAAHLASWAGVCSGNNQSAGKRKSGRTRHGNGWLCSALVEAAWSAVRVSRSYLSAQYHRIASRRGGKRVIIAVAHSILVIIYHMLRDDKTYEDLGASYFDERSRQTTVRRAVQRIQCLGYKVTLETPEPVSSS